MDKAFSRVNWQNLPIKTTPLSAPYLNRGDSALDTIDNRVIALDTNKADKTALYETVTNVSYNPSTGVITVRKYNGTTATYDTGLSKVAVNFSYDETERQIIIYNADGEVIDRVDLSDFITVNVFEDSDTIAFDVESTNVSASVKAGSITDEYLQPNYLADITTQAGLAETSATAAAEYADTLSNAATLAQSYAVGGTGEREGENTDNAKYYKEQAEQFATNDYATLAESYAIGGTGTRDGEDSDNAKYYSEVAASNTITNVTATVDDTVGTPIVEVTKTSGAPNTSFRFDFYGIKGEQGDTGETGTAVIDSSIDDYGHLIIEFSDGSTADAGLLGTNIRQMTQAQYEALSDEEKNDDGMYYWILDADGGTMAIVVSGVSDYTEMLNKPSINGVELEGDISLAELGIYGGLIEITESDFEALTDEEKNAADKWYWIKEDE